MTEEDKMSSLGAYPSRIAALRALGSRGWLEASNAGRRFPADADPALLDWTLDEMGKSDTEVLVELFKFVSSVNARALFAKNHRAGACDLSEGRRDHQRRAHGSSPRQNQKPENGAGAAARPQFTNCRARDVCALEVLYFISQQDGIVCRE